MAKKIYGKDDTGYGVVGEMNDVELVDVAQTKSTKKAKKGAKNEETVKAKKSKKKTAKADVSESCADGTGPDGDGLQDGKGPHRKRSAKRRRAMVAEGYLTDIDIVADAIDPTAESKKDAVITKSADDTATTKKKKKKQS